MKKKLDEIKMQDDIKSLEYILALIRDGQKERFEVYEQMLAVLHNEKLKIKKPQK